MNEDLDKIEEDLKKKSDKKGEIKKSGKSVFKLQDIIKEKSDSSQEGNGEDSKTMAGE